eukprot:1642625-Amphidinium_carterae.2
MGKRLTALGADHEEYHNGVESFIFKLCGDTSRLVDMARYQNLPDMASALSFVIQFPTKTCNKSLFVLIILASEILSSPYPPTSKKGQIGHHLSL